MATVPILWEESDQPFVCGLVFRVGRADESIVAGGITHLVEHLSLPTRWPPEVDFNATVASTFTHFWFMGQKEAALEMLANLTRDLVDPPLDRLGREKSILTAEASWRGRPGTHTFAMFLRYGATGHGLVWLEEYGLRWLGRNEVRSWIRRAFCAANAVAYMTSEPPAGYTLELPQGKRLPPPRLTPIPALSLPAVHCFGPDDSAILSLLVRRTFASRMLAEIAGRRIRGLLRYRLGISYSTFAHYEPLDRRTAHIHLAADTLESNVTAARNGLVVVLDELAERGPTPDELERERETARQETEHPAALASRLHAHACAQLDGSGGLTLAERLAGLGAVTPEDVRQAAAAARQTALLLLPRDAEVPEGRFEPYPSSWGPRVKGRRFSRSADESGSEAPAPDELLVVGDEGVTFESGDDRRTVRFADCAARIRFRQGVALWSPDGAYVWIDTSEWEHGESALNAVEQAAVAQANDIDLRVTASEFDDPDLIAGDRAYDEERWQDAVTGLERGLAREPREPNAWSYLAYSLWQLGQHRRAAEAAMKAAELDPADDWSARFAARELRHTGRTARAAELAAEALRRNPTSIFNLEEAVMAFVEDWRLDEAGRIAVRALELFPKNDRAAFAAGWVAQAAGHVEIAVEELRLAVELDPETSMWHNNLGYALLKAGSLDAALAELDRALELDSESSYAADNRLLALKLLGRDDEAAVIETKRQHERRRRLRELAEGTLDDPDELARLAELAFHVDRAEGLRAVRRAIEGSREPVYLLLQARLELGLDDHEAARRSVAAAAELAPDDVAVLLARVWTAMLAEDRADASAAARRLAELRPGTVPTLLARSFALLAARRWQQALEGAERVLGIDPLESRAQAAAGIALVGLGRRNDALAALGAARRRSVEEDLTTRRLAALLADESAPPAR